MTCCVYTLPRALFVVLDFVCHRDASIRDLIDEVVEDDGALCVVCHVGHKCVFWCASVSNVAVCDQVTSRGLGICGGGRRRRRFGLF